MKAAVFLSGCGVFDGAEIHEAVLSLLHLKKNGFDTQCFAPDVAQHHVVNHRSGEEMAESRNVLTEAARIARGKIQPLTDYRVEDYDAVVMPGGFGVAKNFTHWAFEGPAGSILPELEGALRATLAAKKPIAALCMAPTVLARAIGHDGPALRLTVGAIDEVADGMTSLGMNAVACSTAEPCIDRENKIVSVPCYMMEADIVEIDKGVAAGIKALRELVAQP